MTTLNENLGHTLKRVEEIEGKMEAQTVGIKELKENIRQLKMEQRKLVYKLEDRLERVYRLEKE